MHKSINKLPSGNAHNNQENIIYSSTQLGELVRAQRQQLALRQIDIAGLGNTGNRFIVDLESGKPTIQLQKALDIINLLGLEVVVRPKTSIY